MRGEDVLRVVDALETEEIRFWVAGGWGVDLLTGSPARKHADLDVLLADYDVDASVAVRVLEPLGYGELRASGEDVWMTPRNVLRDGKGHQVELLGLNRAGLDRALRRTDDGAALKPFEEQRPELFAVGMLGGRDVPCLSAELQLLFHSGFVMRGIDRYDVGRLEALVRSVQQLEDALPR